MMMMMMMVMTMMMMTSMTRPRRESVTVWLMQFFQGA
jgi:hypothetical protein